MSRFIEDIEGDLVNIEHVVRVYAVDTGIGEVYNLHCKDVNGTEYCLAINFDCSHEAIQFFREHFL